MSACLPFFYGGTEPVAGGLTEGALSLVSCPVVPVLLLSALSCCSPCAWWCCCRPSCTCRCSCPLTHCQWDSLSSCDRQNPWYFFNSLFSWKLVQSLTSGQCLKQWRWLIAAAALSETSTIQQNCHRFLTNNAIWILNFILYIKCLEALSLTI